MKGRLGDWRLPRWGTEVASPAGMAKSRRSKSARTNAKRNTRSPRGVPGHVPLPKAQDGAQASGGHRQRVMHFPDEVGQGDINARLGHDRASGGDHVSNVASVRGSEPLLGQKGSTITSVRTEPDPLPHNVVKRAATTSRKTSPHERALAWAYRRASRVQSET